MDLHAASRGVIAGGWSITYNTSFITRTTDAPALIPLSGPAAPYPITFDLSRIGASTRAGFVSLEVQLQHGWSDDIRMVLESPNGTAVILMANAGGNSPLLSTTTIRFSDLAPVLMPDDGPLGSGTYLQFKPGSIYELPIAPLPSPAPPGPVRRGVQRLPGRARPGHLEVVGLRRFRFGCRPVRQRLADHHAP